MRRRISASLTLGPSFGADGDGIASLCFSPTVSATEPIPSPIMKAMELSTGTGQKCSRPQGQVSPLVTGERR